MGLKMRCSMYRTDHNRILRRSTATMRRQRHSLETIVG